MSVSVKQQSAPVVEAPNARERAIQNVDDLAEMLRVLADPTRIRLIDALERNGRSTVSALTTLLPVSQQSVSHQLSILRGAGIVSRRREGVWVHYELRDWMGAWLLHQLADGLQS
jgi:DNA-binding transcriptional ArsR family regulator